MVAGSLEEYAMDPDLHFHELGIKAELIDSKGDQFAWQYSQTETANIPSSKEKSISIEELKSSIANRFPKLKDSYMHEQSFSGLLNRLHDSI